MTVEELITALQKEDPTKAVVFANNYTDCAVFNPLEILSDEQFLAQVAGTCEEDGDQEGGLIEEVAGCVVVFCTY